MLPPSSPSFGLSLSPSAPPPALELTAERMAQITQLAELAADKKVRISVTSTSLYIEPMIEVQIPSFPAVLGTGLPGRGD